MYNFINTLAEVFLYLAVATVILTVILLVVHVAPMLLLMAVGLLVLVGVVLVIANITGGSFAGIMGIAIIVIYLFISGYREEGSKEKE